jgi:hypothetical protein
VINLQYADYRLLGRSIFRSSGSHIDRESVSV